ncbi:hypothetical protein M0804_015487 [Polistes exclamans]|nr:hypothetical protein M0804_015487 [Polistes exclamans]
MEVLMIGWGMPGIGGGVLPWAVCMDKASDHFHHSSHVRISVDNTVQELLSQEYYEFPEVCSASIKYWFNVFIEDEFKYSHLNGLYFVRFGQIGEFLLQLLIENPSWTTDHFMDALKATNETIHKYMKELDYSYICGSWCKLQ